MLPKFLGGTVYVLLKPMQKPGANRVSSVNRPDLRRFALEGG